MYSARFPATLRLAIEGAIERVIRDHHLGRVPEFGYTDGEGELEVLIVSTGPTEVPFDRLRVRHHFLGTDGELISATPAQNAALNDALGLGQSDEHPEAVSGVAEEDEQPEAAFGVSEEPDGA